MRLIKHVKLKLMKKFLIVLFLTLLFGATVNKISAQTVYYRTTQFAIKYKTNYGWTNWTNWEKSSMKLKFDLDDDLIIIYSSKIQIYKILSDEGSYVDDSGGKQQKYFVIDQDDDYGYVRLRVEKNGNSQIYIDFNDVMWVYNVVRIVVD